MTTSIRTRHNSVEWINSLIESYADYVEHDEDGHYSESVVNSIFDYMVSAVNDALPDNLTWYPYCSEVYASFDENGDDDTDDNEEDDESLDDTIARLANEYLEKLEAVIDWERPVTEADVDSAADKI